MNKYIILVVLQQSGHIIFGHFFRYETIFRNKFLYLRLDII